MTAIRRSRFNASTLASTTTEPTTTITVSRSPNANDAMPMAVGGIRYSVIVARLRSTCASTYAQARYAKALGKMPRPITASDTLNHRLDGAIVAVDVERSQLRRTPMYREDLLLIAPTSMGPIRDVADLQDKTVFMWPVGCPYRAALEHWLLRQGQALPIVSLASNGAIVGCVSAGAGVALVPKGVFDQYARGAGCAGYEFAELTAIDNLFYWHENAGVHPAREAFVAMLREEFA